MNATWVCQQCNGVYLLLTPRCERCNTYQWLEGNLPGTVRPNTPSFETIGRLEVSRGQAANHG
jgi:hypothetical protein